MSKEVVKASKTLRGSTSTISHVLDANERAREIYLAGIKRLEAEYYDRLKRAVEIFANVGEAAASETVTSEAPPETSDGVNAAATA